MLPVYWAGFCCPFVSFWLPGKKVCRAKPHSFLQLFQLTFNYLRIDLPHFDMPINPCEGLK